MDWQPTLWPEGLWPQRDEDAAATNGVYTVAISWLGAMDGGAYFCLIVERNDGSALMDWTSLQAVKNAILGPDAEAVELYPAQSRVRDEAHRRWLWAVVGKRFPIGIDLPPGALRPDKITMSVEANSAT